MVHIGSNPVDDALVTGSENRPQSPGQPGPHGADGVLRSSKKHRDRVTPWWPDNVDPGDAAHALCEAVRSELDSIDDPDTEVDIAMIAFSETGTPDYDYRAAAVRLPEPPWDPASTGTWLLFYESVDIAVIEYPDREHAVAAFLKHTNDLAGGEDRYDYLVDRRHLRKPVPPAPRFLSP